MKILYDCVCSNEQCSECGTVIEIRKGINDPCPNCDTCGQEMKVYIGKGVSFHLKGGKSAGFQNDGRVVTGPEPFRRRK